MSTAPKDPRAKPLAFTPEAEERLSANPSLAGLLEVVSSPPRSGQGAAWLEALRELREAGVVAEPELVPQKTYDPVPQGVPTRRYVDPDLAAERAAERERMRPRAVLQNMQDVVAEEVRWLWPGRIPLGRLTMLMGRMGTGKSTLLGWLMAQVSTGRPWPDANAPNQPGGVILLQSEEVASEDLRPRLDAEGADPRRIKILKSVARGDAERTFSLADDIDALADAIDRVENTRLIIIEPISNYLKAVNAFRDTEVREVLQPLTDLAYARGVTLLMVQHPTKNEEKDILDRAANSAAFLQVARMAWYYSVHPRDKNARILSLMKGNFRGATKTALVSAYKAHKVTWRPKPVRLDAFEVDALLQAKAREQRISGLVGRPAGAISRACKAVVAALEAGPLAASALAAKAKEEGVSAHTYRRALKRLYETDGRIAQFEDDGVASYRLVASAEPPAEPPTGPPAGGDPGDGPA